MSPNDSFAATAVPEHAEGTAVKPGTESDARSR